MTNPPNPFQPGQPGDPSATQPLPVAQPGPAGWQAPPTWQPTPGATPPLAKRGNPLTSKPMIGIGSLVVGLVLGASMSGGSRPATLTDSLASASPTATESALPSEEPTPSATATESTPAPAPEDSSFKYGQKISFMYEEMEITVRVDAPKPSPNLFDKNNLEAKVTVCNLGTETITELSADGLGLYAEDKKDDQYDLYGAYRSPEFPVYEFDSAKLKANKCRTGWVAFENGAKAIRIATEVEDTTYSWSATGE